MAEALKEIIDIQMGLLNEVADSLLVQINGLKKSVNKVN
jgi:hypothetical protein